MCLGVNCVSDMAHTSPRHHRARPPLSGRAFIVTNATSVLASRIALLNFPHRRGVADPARSSSAEEV